MDPRRKANEEPVDVAHFQTIQPQTALAKALENSPYLTAHVAHAGMHSMKHHSHRQDRQSEFSLVNLGHLPG